MTEPAPTVPKTPATTEFPDLAAPIQGVAAFTERGLVPADARQLSDLARKLFRDPLMPQRGFRSAETVFGAIDLAARMGLPIGSIPQLFYVVANKVSLEGACYSAVIQGAAVTEYYELDTEGELFLGDGKINPLFAGVCRSKRRDREKPNPTVRFTIAEAIAAGLYPGASWTKWPTDHAIWKAGARAGRRHFGDVLYGVGMVEDLAESRASDYEPRAEIDVTPPREKPQRSVHPAFVNLGGRDEGEDEAAEPASQSDPPFDVAGRRVETQTDASPTDPARPPQPLPPERGDAIVEIAMRIDQRALALVDVSAEGGPGLHDRDATAYAVEIRRQVLDLVSQETFADCDRDQLELIASALPGFVPEVKP